MLLFFAGLAIGDRGRGMLEYSCTLAGGTISLVRRYLRYAGVRKELGLRKFALRGAADKEVIRMMMA